MSELKFEQSVQILNDHIDGLGHVNNVQYLRWVEQVAWAHSEQLGLGLVEYQRLDTAMVAREHRLVYKAACFVGQQILLRTWLGERDALNLCRHYQFIRVDDQQVVFEGRTHWVCIRLSTGRPQRMPAEFRQAYGVV